MVTITSGGTSSYAIVLAGGAAVTEQSAANEIREYVRRMSGVTLPVVSESSAPANAIFVGRTAFATTNSLVPSGSEAWRVKTVGSRVAVVGGSPRGTLYGAYHLLEDVWGVHWWNPWEEHVPTAATLTVTSTMDLSGEPGLGYRDIYDGLYDPGVNYAGVPPHSLFYVRNRLNGSFSFAPPTHGGTISFGWPYHAHTFELYMPPEEFFDAHPEYFSLVGGARTRNAQLCLTHPDVLSIMTQRVRASIDASYANADSNGMPRPKIFSLTPNDWMGFCEHSACAASRAAHGDSGYLLVFANAIATALASSYPDVLFDTFAYWFYIDPPVGVVPASNVQIRYANISYDVLHDLSHTNNSALRTKLEAWAGLTDNVSFWGYPVNFWPNPPFAVPTRHRNDASYLRGIGASGGLFEVEGSITSDFWDLNSWVLAKFLENPDLDRATVISTFTAGYYGAAGPFIDEVLERTRVLLASTGNRATFGTSIEVYTFYTLAFVNGLTAQFASAETAVAANPTLLRRVRHARASLDRLILFKWADLVSQSQSSGVPMAFDRKTSAARYTQTIRTMKQVRSLATGPQQPWNELQADNELRSLVYPPALSEVPLRCMAAAGADDFRLWTANGGASLVDDPTSIVGRAARIVRSSIDTAANRELHEAPMHLGVYNTTTGGKVLRTLQLADLAPGAYRLHHCGSAVLSAGEYLYLFRSWWIQLDVDALIAGRPAQEYDVYVSMKVQGAVYGGSAADADTIWVDRIILVAKGQMPAALSGVNPAVSTDFGPETFRLWTAGGGVSRAEDASALTLRSASITLSRITAESDRSLHTLSVASPNLMGLHNPTDGPRVLRQLVPADIVPDAWSVYSMTNVEVRPGDYLFLFRSWWIQIDFDQVRSSNPATRYDIHVSMKFVGPAYGGSAAKKDAVFVDRVVLVER